MSFIFSNLGDKKVLKIQLDFLVVELLLGNFLFQTFLVKLFFSKKNFLLESFH